jgi:hypothetical protein
MRKAVQAAFDAMPKQEPVGYCFPSEYQEALNTESCCDLYVIAVDNFETGESSNMELYTNPQPKREPLNAHEIKQLLKRDDGLNVTDLVRAVEKAHGIGV